MSSEAKTMHKIRLNLRLHSSQIPKFSSQKGHLRAYQKHPNSSGRGGGFKESALIMTKHWSIIYLFQEIYPNIHEIS